MTTKNKLRAERKKAEKVASQQALLLRSQLRAQKTLFAMKVALAHELDDQPLTNHYLSLLASSIGGMSKAVAMAKVESRQLQIFRLASQQFIQAHGSTGNSDAPVPKLPSPVPVVAEPGDPLLTIPVVQGGSNDSEED